MGSPSAERRTLDSGRYCGRAGAAGCVALTGPRRPDLGPGAGRCLETSGSSEERHDGEATASQSRAVAAPQGARLAGRQPCELDRDASSTVMHRGDHTRRGAGARAGGAPRTTDAVSGPRRPPQPRVCALVELSAERRAPLPRRARAVGAGHRYHVTARQPVTSPALAQRSQSMTTEVSLAKPETRPAIDTSRSTR